MRLETEKCEVSKKTVIGGAPGVLSHITEKYINNALRISAGQIKYQKCTFTSDISYPFTINLSVERQGHCSIDPILRELDAMVGDETVRQYKAFESRDDHFTSLVMNHLLPQKCSPFELMNVKGALTVEVLRDSYVSDKVSPILVPIYKEWVDRGDNLKTVSRLKKASFHIDTLIIKLKVKQADSNEEYLLDCARLDKLSQIMTGVDLLIANLSPSAS